MSSSGTFGSSERWITAFLNSPGSLGSNYSYTTPIIPDGAYRVRVRPIDNHDLFPSLPRGQRDGDRRRPATTAPVAVAHGAAATRTCARSTVAASTDENAPTLTYSWNFGNGRTGSGALPTTTYTSAGTFTPTLTVRDEYGLTSIGDPVAGHDHRADRQPAADRGDHDADLRRPGVQLQRCHLERPEHRRHCLVLLELRRRRPTSTSSSPSRTFRRGWHVPSHPHRHRRLGQVQHYHEVGHRFAMTWTDQAATGPVDPPPAPHNLRGDLESWLNRQPHTPGTWGTTSRWCADAGSGWLPASWSA